MAGGRTPEPDSVKRNPQAKALFARLLKGGSIEPGDTANKWFTNPLYKRQFAGVSKDKLRKYFDYQLRSHFGTHAVKIARQSARSKGMYQFFYSRIRTNYQALRNTPTLSLLL